MNINSKIQSVKSVFEKQSPRSKDCSTTRSLYRALEPLFLHDPLAERKEKKKKRAHTELLYSPLYTPEFT